MIVLPGRSHQASFQEMLTLDPRDPAAKRTDRREVLPRFSKRDPPAYGTHSHDRRNHRSRLVLCGIAAQKLTDLPSSVGVVPAKKKALELRQDELRTHVAAQAAN